MSDDIKILIVGLGLIGGSYAQGLSKKGYTVYAIDKNPNSIKYGVDNNIIKGFNGSNNDLIKESDLIILSLYPLDNVNWIKDNKQFFKENQLIYNLNLNLKLYKLNENNLKNELVIITEAEHASNVLPWFVLAKEIGIVIKYIDLSLKNEVTLENLEKVITNQGEWLKVVTK